MRVVERHIAGPHAHSEALVGLIRASQVQLVYVCGVDRDLHGVLLRVHGPLFTALVLAIQLIKHILGLR